MNSRPFPQQGVYCTLCPSAAQKHSSFLVEAGSPACKIVTDEKTKRHLENLGILIGSKVTIKDLADNTEATYTIVGTVEANPVKGLISNVSPLGRAIVDHAVGDVVVVHVAQEYKVEILKIESK